MNDDNVTKILMTVTEIPDYWDQKKRDYGFHEFSERKGLETKNYPIITQLKKSIWRDLTLLRPLNVPDGMDVIEL